MDVNKKKNIYIFATVMIGMVFIAYIIHEYEDFKLWITSGIFTLAIIGIFISYQRYFDHYMITMLSQVSILISTITDMQEVELYSTLEDTMLSKLQSQILKLTGLLKAQNNQIAADRNEMKSLVSDISHQLKTPLANLKMYGELLKEDSISIEERKEFTETMLLSVNKLSFLAESMIMMSRLESGIIQLKPEYHSLNKTLLMSLKQVYQKAKQKNIIITLNELHEVELMQDKNWTAEALFNILDNGVKYTPVNGNIIITIQKYEIFARIDIKDNGIGISEGEQAKVFTRFYRGSNVNESEGIGLGLYISREIISLQGGYIKIKSGAEGSVFSIFLPI